MKKKTRLLIIMSIGVLAMSSASLFIRWAQADGVESMVIAAYRLSIATLAVSIPAIFKQTWKAYAKLSKKNLIILVISGLLLGLHFATWITSLTKTSVMNSAVLVTTTPLWLGLAAPLILKEHTPALTWVGMFITISGGIVITLASWSGGGSTQLWGNVLALAGAVFVAGSLLIGRGTREDLPLLAYLWIVYGTAAVLLVTWSFAAGLPVTGFKPQTYGLLLALGLIPQLIGHTAANYAVRQVSATLVAIMTLGEPVATSILAAVFLKELPTTLQIGGGLLILIGIALALQAEERKTRKNNQMLTSPDSGVKD